ncbi:hypothetical protein MBLNU457_6813t1 [Dothideomycetes sp. NU457]
MSRVSAQYKKKDGFLALGDDRKFVFWSPASPPNATPTLTVPVTDITNLQQTPATSLKIALKVVVQPTGATEPENHVFSFVSGSARQEQETITGALRDAISAVKAGTTNIPAAPAAPAVQDDSGQSAAMAIAQAVSGGAKKATDGWYDDNSLRNDIDLQRSLLSANEALRQRFNESLRDKPESISISQFSTQFWSTRLHHLRAHAIEKAQQQGDYNVLPEIKFKRIPAEREGEPDKLMLNLAKEQVKLIFKQYPIVREAYNDNVPQIDQNQFWSRFFMSRLLKRLKGEKITDQDGPDPIFDKYLEFREKAPTNTAPVPNFIDLEGNEQNHSQRKGNRPDETMRPGNLDKVPILRVLNNLSEKMLSQVAPQDGLAHGPVGMNEETFEQLQLRDLQATNDDNRVKLNIRDQQKFLAGEQDDQISADGAKYAKQDPEKVLADMRQDLDPRHLGEDKQGSLRLDQAIGGGSDSEDSDEEMDGQTNGTKKKPVRLGGSTALGRATGDLVSSIRLRKAATSSEDMGTFGLTQTTFDTLTMTHNTTIEFLHYFWTLFLSGDASRTTELAKLVETLDKSVDRINAVAKTAAEEKQKKIESLKTAMQGLKSASNKRRRLEMDLESIGGGKDAVQKLVAPTIRAIHAATSQYRKAFEEQTAQAAAAA